MADLTFKRFDTYPPMFASLTDSNGIINLSTASAVHMEMKSSTTGTIIPTLICVIASAAGGYVQHNWVASETSMADSWSAEFEILWANGGVQTVPNDGVKTILIEADLESA